MKKTTTLWRIFFLTLLALTATAQRGYTQEQIEIGEIEFGKTYSLPSNSETTGFFVAPRSGNLTAVYSQRGYCVGLLYGSEDFSEASEIAGWFNTNYMSPAFTYAVEGGKTYYVKAVRWFYDESTSMTLYMEGEVELPFEVSIMSPSTSGRSTFNLTEERDMFVRYTQYVQNPTVIVKYASNGGEQITEDITSYSYIEQDYLFISMRNYLEGLLTDDSSKGIRPGAAFTVSVRAENDKGEYAKGADKDGFFNYSYVCGTLPTTVVTTSIPEQFLSYWPKGDPAGMMSVTYSAPLSTSRRPTATIAMGNIEGTPGVDYYRSNVPVSVDGNTVTVDLTGVRRSIRDILSGGGEYTSMTVQVSGLYDQNNEPVISNLGGYIGSYVVELPYVDLAKGQVNSDWMPAAGSKLDNVSEIEVWITGLNNIGFDGFTFEITNGGQTNKVLVPMEEVKKSEETSDGNEAVFTFSVPEAAKTAESVTVYPTNLVSYDGYEYDIYLTALYNSFALVALSPSQGSEIANLQDQTIQAMFNYIMDYPYMYVEFSLVNASTRQEVISPQAMERDGYNIFTYTVGEKTKLYVNNTYNAVFTAWATEEDYLSGKDPIGKTEAVWYGTSNVYINSDVRLEGITPEAGTDLASSDGLFTMNFDGMVKIDPNSYYTPFMTEPQSFTSLTPVGENQFTNPDDGQTYSREWELRVNPEYIKKSYPEMTLTIIVIDEEGRVLRGNRGQDEDSYFEFSYRNTTSVNDVDIAENGRYTVYTLTGIKVMETAEREDLKNLPAGLYIINGKKVAIR